MTQRFGITLAATLLISGSVHALPPVPPAGGPPPITAPAQLMITDLGVVQDPVRTNPQAGNKAVWTFQYLIRNMAGAQDPAVFALQWLEQWEHDQVINGHVSPARPQIRKLVIDPWLAASGGQKLDLTKAPFKLLATVNRMDLRVTDHGHVVTAGEGRFVFGVLGADGKPLPALAGNLPGGFNIIFEYGLLATNMPQLSAWATQWAGLGRYPVGSPNYNAALEALTRRFTDHGQAPTKPNGSALDQLRSNELSLGAPWELREFVIDATTGLLRQKTVAQTPDIIALNGTPALADLINSNETALLNETFVLSTNREGAASLAGPFQERDFPNASQRTFTTIELRDPFFDVPWSAAGIHNNDARQAFAINTCGGCHRTETGANFQQIGFPRTNSLPASLGRPAALAGFLTGSEVPDPVDPTTTRIFGDLERRRLDLVNLLASFGPTGTGPGPQGRHVPNFVH